MKIKEKDIMALLLIGGFTISLSFTMAAWRKTAAPSKHTGNSRPIKPATPYHSLQNAAPAFCIRMIKKFITN